MTTHWGSWPPLSRSTTDAAGMPKMRVRKTPMRRATKRTRGLGWASHANAAQRRTAATEPQVPGPGLMKPTPKKVAMAHQRRFAPFWFWSGALEVPSMLIGTVAVGAEAPEIFENFRVEDGRADFVDAHGPFAEIDFAAAVAAEWEVFVADADDHCAGWTVEEFGGFFSGRHIV